MDFAAAGLDAFALGAADFAALLLGLVLANDFVSRAGRGFAGAVLLADAALLALGAIALLLLLAGVFAELLAGVLAEVLAGVFGAVLAALLVALLEATLGASFVLLAGLLAADLEKDSFCVMLC